MVSSKDMQPETSPFFPNIFFKNQFRSKPQWPPKDTDLTDEVAIVTGANQGLGLEASDQLLSLKLTRLIMAVRSVAKGEVATSTVRAKYPKATIVILPLDMSSYASIQAFVKQIEQVGRLDIAILNAGVRKAKFELVSSTSHEETIQVNYTSTSLLCILLLPILKRNSPKGPGRMTIVGSGLAFAAKFRNRTASQLLPSFDNASSFDVIDQYNTSKLLGMMFLYKLADYVSADDVIVNLVDPGFVGGTGLARNLPVFASTLLTVWKSIAARSLPVGASTYVDAAVLKGKESHGCYIMSWDISPFAGFLYTPEGQRIIEILWRETVAELSFADVQDVLDNLKKL